jgi:tetratricopeptide (TPR) repeat protein
MSLPVTVTFMLADWIAKGLKDGTFERVGGVIREVASKKIVTWLRDNRSLAPQAMSFATNPVTGVLNLIVSRANTAISTKGFADVNRRLGGIEQDLGVIGQSLQVTQGILQITTAASVLNLGVSVMGFAVISQCINEIENQLKQAAELLNKINRKIDLSFYANFHAGIELALNAFTMTRVENRRSSALQAINRFLEAEHIYKDYTVNELSQKSPIIDKYILTLSLAYIAEARCHLELEEHETALRRFQEGAKFIRLLLQKYIELMLTSNPAAYLHPQFKGQIDLHKLTQIYQWIDPNFN